MLSAQRFKQLGVIILGLLFPSQTFAHELWFVHQGMEGMGAAPTIFTQPTALGMYLGAATVCVFVLLLGLSSWHKRSLRMQTLERRFVLPFHGRQILAAMLGVGLLGNALYGTVLAPNFEMPSGTVGTVFLYGAVVIGMGLIFFEYLWFEFCVLLLAFYVLFCVYFGLEAGLAELLFPGCAVFLMMTAPRTWFGGRIKLLARQRAYAFMRVCAGLNFLALASVKWLQPELGMKMIADYHMNILSGFGMSDATFLFCAALVETMAGLALVFNVFTRWFAVLLFPIFTVTVFILGPKELIGHLPIKAMLACFVLYGYEYNPRFKTHISVHGTTTQAFEQLPL